MNVERSYHEPEHSQSGLAMRTTLALNSHAAMEIGSQDYAETGMYMAKNVTVA